MKIKLHKKLNTITEELNKYTRMMLRNIEINKNVELGQEHKINMFNIYYQILH